MAQALYLGLDVGTQGVKGVVIDADARPCVISRAGRPLDLIGDLPPGAAEQNPDDWWNAVVEVVREHYPDHTDDSERFGMVDFKALGAVETPVTLADIKAEARLQDLLLVRNSRLSVVPVGLKEWKIICAMAGVDP